MPTFPISKCSEFGCKNLCATGKSVCATHAPKLKTKVERETFNKFYKLVAWDTLRKRQFSIQPLCQACMLNGHIAMASHLDHLFAWNHIGEGAFMRNVFQSLCPECHGVKSGLEKKGIFRHYVQPEPMDYSIDQYESVVTHHENTSPSHH